MLSRQTLLVIDTRLSALRRDYLSTQRAPASNVSCYTPADAQRGTCVHAVRARLSTAKKWAERESATNQLLMIGKPLAERQMDPFLRHLAQDSSSGDKVIGQMQEDISGFVPSPTDFQRMMMGFLIELQAPAIYKQEWTTRELAIRQRYGWERITHGIGGVMTGRKEGKTTGSAMALLNIMMNRPSVQIALFSKTRGQAQIMLDMAKLFACSHIRSNQYKVEATRETIRLTHTMSGNVRHCKAFSGNADVSLRVFLRFV